MEPCPFFLSGLSFSASAASAAAAAAAAAAATAAAAAAAAAAAPDHSDETRGLLHYNFSVPTAHHQRQTRQQKR